MAPNNSTSPRNRNLCFRPRRGQIKARILESIGETIASAALKTGEALGFIKNGHGGGGSDSSSPPPSAYNTDGYIKSWLNLHTHKSIEAFVNAFVGYVYTCSDKDRKR